MIYADDVSKDVIYILNCIDGLHFLFSWLWILLNETFGAKKCTPDTRMYKWSILCKKKYIFSSKYLNQISTMDTAWPTIQFCGWGIVIMTNKKTHTSEAHHKEKFLKSFFILRTFFYIKYIYLYTNSAIKSK